MSLSSLPSLLCSEKFCLNQFLAKRVDASTAQPLLGDTKVSKPLVHFDSEECCIVVVDAIEPMPFFIGHVFACRHRRWPFALLMIPRTLSHADGCFVDWVEA